MLKYLSAIRKKLFEFGNHFIIFARKMINYILSINIDTNILSIILIFIGTAILVIGVLSRNAVDVINNSLIGNDGYGVLVGIYFPDNILSFMLERNRIYLGLTVTFSGILLELFHEKYPLFPFKYFIISLVFLYLLCSTITGYNRKIIINSWKNDNCRYQWLINKLFTRKYLHETLNEFAKTNQTEEFLIDIFGRMRFVKNALGIEIKYKFKSDDKPSLNEIEAFQDKMRKEIDNTSIFYYLFKPKKLLYAFW